MTSRLVVKASSVGRRRRGKGVAISATKILQFQLKAVAYTKRSLALRAVAIMPSKNWRDRLATGYLPKEGKAEATLKDSAGNGELQFLWGALCDARGRHLFNRA